MDCVTYHYKEKGNKKFFIIFAHVIGESIILE